jgi:WD40 repeat protein
MGIASGGSHHGPKSQWDPEGINFPFFRFPCDLLQTPASKPAKHVNALAPPYISSWSMLMQVNLGSTSDAVESVANVTDIHEAMFFHADDEEVTRSNFGIWSLRWSPDGKEIIAGTGDSSLYLYDVEQQKVGLLS